jgi:hypothetical protein
MSIKYIEQPGQALLRPLGHVLDSTSSQEDKAFSAKKLQQPQAVEIGSQCEASEEAENTPCAGRSAVGVALVIMPLIGEFQGLAPAELSAIRARSAKKSPRYVADAL